MLDVPLTCPSIDIDRNEPDADAIEMFCGQIPRTMSERELRSLFEHYGRIYKLNILRDRQSGESKGCCFVTYYTRQAALNAQNALHNSVVLPGMHHAIQMKPADIENRNERKIFIGMISKCCQEDEIKRLFLPFGTIEECTVLRDVNNRSRGCAFVTYQKRQSALNAIQVMHHSCTMNGCSSPINVRFADTPKEKEIRKMQLKLNDDLLQKITTNTPPSVTNTSESLNSLNLMLFNQLYSNVLTSFNEQKHQQSNSNHNDLSCGDNNMHDLHSNLLMSHQANNRLTAFSNITNEWPNAKAVEYQSRVLNNSVSSINENNIGKDASSNIHRSLLCGEDPCIEHKHITIDNKDILSTPINSFLNTEISSCIWSNPTDDDLRLLDSFLSPAINGISNIPNLSSSTKQINTPSMVNIRQQQNNNSSQIISSNDEKQLIGPVGCNLFIYHLPSEFTDHDLAQTFAPFGNILSAKVFIDRLTNRSKCFGFVSYDNMHSASQAIQRMDGFQIGLKRLKVQLKKNHLQ